MVKKFGILLIALIMLPIFFIYSQSEPIVSVPYSIINYVNLSNPSSYAEYKIELLNSLNQSVMYSFSTLSPLWNVIFGMNNQNQYGILGPGQSLDVILYLRPYQITNEICDIVLNYKYLNGTPIISYTIPISPTIYYQISPLSNVYAYISLENTTLYQGSYERIILNIINNNNFPINSTLYLYTGWGYYNQYNFTLYPGNNTFSESFQIPFNLNPGVYNITTIFNNVSEEIFTVTVFPSISKLNISPEIIIKNGEIIIYNPSNYSIEYQYILNVSQGLLPFYIITPKPQQILYSNGLLRFIYYIYLPPNEFYIIKFYPNYFLILSILIIILLAVILILFIFFVPFVDVRKRIIRYNIKSRTFTVEINIRNRSLIPIYNVRIEDIVPKDLEILNYETVEPTRIYKEENMRLVWNFEKIDRGSELIISYTIKVPEKLNSFNLPPSNIRYEFTFRSIEKKSNGLRISFI